MNNSSEPQARPSSATKKFIYDPASMLLPHEKFGREQAQLDKLKHLGPKNETPTPVPVLRTQITAVPASRSPDHDSGSQTSLAESHPPPYSEVPARGDPSLHDRPGHAQSQAGGSASGSSDRAGHFEQEASGARGGSIVPSGMMSLEDEQELKTLETEMDDGTTESPALLSDWEVVETLGEYGLSGLSVLTPDIMADPTLIARYRYIWQSPTRPPSSPLSI